MSLHALETTIAKFDPSFVVSDLSSDAFLTDNQSTGSLLPMLRYATPSGDIGPLHQYEMHLNIERFRVPEVRSAGYRRHVLKGIVDSLRSHDLRPGPERTGARHSDGA